MGVGNVHEEAPRLFFGLIGMMVVQAAGVFIGLPCGVHLIVW